MKFIKLLFSWYRRATPLLTCAILTGAHFHLHNVCSAALGGALVFFVAQRVGKVFEFARMFVAELGALAQVLLIFSFLLVIFHLGLWQVSIPLAAESAGAVALGWLL